MPTPILPIDRRVHDVSTILNFSITKAKLEKLYFINTKQAYILYTTFRELTHPQSPALNHIDNKYEAGITKVNI